VTAGLPTVLLRLEVLEVSRRRRGTVRHGPPTPLGASGATSMREPGSLSPGPRPTAARLTHPANGLDQPDQVSLELLDRNPVGRGERRLRRRDPLIRVYG